MLKVILVGVLLVVGGKWGFSYVLSEDFQKFADDRKAQWSCPLNYFIGNMYITMNHYDKAHRLFDRILQRCPTGQLAEDAEFRIAECLEGLGRRRDAATAYEKFAANHPNSRRAKLAANSAYILKS